MSEQRLAKIEADQARALTLLENLTRRVEERIEHDDAWRRRIERTVYGDGNGNLGHHIKLDRLCQSHERQKWLIRAVAVGVITLVGNALLGMLAA